MPEVQTVAAQIGANQVCEGFYTLDDGVLTMVAADGSTLGLTDDLAKHIMRAGDNEVAIAKMLTKKIRSHFRGEIVPGFSRDIAYPISGVA